MGSQVQLQIVYCNFPALMTTTKFYSCYRKESCCAEGCCVSGPYQIYQLWYYWLLFLIIFGIISGGSWLCKKPRPAQSTLTRNSPSTSQNIRNYALARCSRRRCPTSFDSVNNNENAQQSNCEENIILDRLFVSFRNRNSMGDPPSYTSILPMDLNSVQPKICPLYSYYGPPPKYSSMYILPSGPVMSANNSRPIEDNSNVTVPAATTETAGNVTHIQVHAEENGIQAINNLNSEEQRCSTDSPGSRDGGNDSEGETPSGTTVQNHSQANPTPENG